MHKTAIWMAIGVALLTSDCRGDFAHKRLPFGFQGMRGKKSVDLTALDENFDQGELDRAPYPSIPNFDDLTRFASIHDPWLLARVQDDLYERPNQLSSFKRAPMGFLGMRGKKNNPLDGGPLYQNALEEYANPEYMEKRGLKGFQGMRGKKQFEYLKSKYFNKRKTMGFQGMRGKKDNIGDEPLNYYGEDSVNDLQNYLIDSGMPYQTYASDEYFDGEKRGLKGFQGMRGKREFEMNNNMEENKRAPSGFMGMRGKKDDTNEEHAKLDAGKEDVKPTSQSSENTIGMQEVVSAGILPPTNSNEQVSSLDNFGVSDQDVSNNLSGAVSIKERRSPNYGFYGVRGKKGPNMSSFYGVRGKKAPYGFPFRGKFVGVRGKKSDNMQHLEDGLAFDVDSYQKRRGPSGFVGMRGKKSITPDDEYDMMNEAEE